MKPIYTTFPLAMISTIPSEFMGGVNNLGNETPFITEQAFPVSPRGRYFFLGVNAAFE